MSVTHLFDLPTEVLDNIIELLDLKAISNLMKTCRLMKRYIITNSSIWKNLTRNQLFIHERRVDKNSDSWIFNAARISHNWTRGIYQQKQVLKFSKKYMPWMKYGPEEMLVSMGSELRCYHVNKLGIPKCHRTLWKLTVPKLGSKDIRTNDIARFVYRDTLIVVGHRDGSANLYKVDNPRTEPRLIQRFPDCIEPALIETSCVEVICNQNRAFMVTGSDRCDQLIFWNWPKDDGAFKTTELQPVRKCKKVSLARGVYMGPRCLAINESADIIAIGPDGGEKPVFLDVNAMRIIAHRRPRIPSEVVRDITWHDYNTVAYVSHHYAKLAMMDVRSQETIYELPDPLHEALYCVKTDGNNALVVGSAVHSRCVLYDRRMARHHVQMYFTQKERSPVYSLDFTHLKLVAAIDRSIAVVDFDIFPSSTKKRDFSKDVFSPIQYRS